MALSMGNVTKQSEEETDFDLQSLRLEFKKYCPDFMEEIDCDSKTITIYFVRCMLKLQCENNTYRIGDRFNSLKYNLNVEDKEQYVCIVTDETKLADIKSQNLPNTLVLSFKQVILIIHDTIERGVRCGMKQDKYYLTPLAITYFHVTKLKCLARDIDMTLENLLITINQSIEEEGHYLSKSDIDFAIVCSFFRAKRLNINEMEKKLIVVRTFENYVAKGQFPDMKRISLIYTISIIDRFHINRSTFLIEIQKLVLPLMAYLI